MITAAFCHLTSKSQIVRIEYRQIFGKWNITRTEVHPISDTQPKPISINTVFAITFIEIFIDPTSKIIAVR